MSQVDTFVFAVTVNQILDEIEGQLLLLESHPEENGRLDNIEEKITFLRSEAEQYKFTDIANICDRVVHLVHRLRSRPDAVKHNAISVMFHFVDGSRRHINGIQRMAG